MTLSAIKKMPVTPASTTALRRQAEARLRELRLDDPSQPASFKSAADSRRLLHEVQVHQMELEMQNAELRRAQDSLEVALENYTDLYDFAPVGYFSQACGAEPSFLKTLSPASAVSGGRGLQIQGALLLLALVKDFNPFAFAPGRFGCGLSFGS